MPRWLTGVTSIPPRLKTVSFDSIRVQVDDYDDLRRVIDIFMTSSEVTMDFVVNVAGQVVKSFRDNKDEQV